MANDDLKVITIKMPSEELDALQSYLTLNDLDNRSEIVRQAIKQFINGEALKAEAKKEGVLVHLNPVLMRTLDNLVESGMCSNSEEYIKSLVIRDLVPDELKLEMKRSAFDRAVSSSRDR